MTCCILLLATVYLQCTLYSKIVIPPVMKCLSNSTSTMPMFYSLALSEVLACTFQASNNNSNYDVMKVIIVGEASYLACCLE